MSMSSEMGYSLLKITTRRFDLRGENVSDCSLGTAREAREGLVRLTAADDVSLRKLCTLLQC